ncbi:MAG TPA: hypothetical protein VF283_08635 [Bryobacteraceae bacterium]
MAEPCAVCAALCILAALAAWFCFRHGYILYWGDAQAHLNISRSILDSRTPGYDQIGTVWLPILHVVCLPFVTNDWLWSTGLAGTIPVAICFVIAGMCFYFAAKTAYANSAAALVAVAVFALNPNILYLASIPMTEVVFFAGLGAALLAMLRFQATQNRRWIVLGIAASWWMSLTRYDGWFLIPFLAVSFAFFARRHRIAVFVIFGALASLAPLYWIAHNWWESGNALYFYNGPYSAKAIQGNHWYPGDRDWLLALLYYGAASRLCSGWPLIVLGCAGLALAIWKRRAFGACFLLLTPAFYVWSMHSSGGTPIHVPQLWPHSYYNTRYGTAIVAAAAFAAGAIVTLIPRGWRKFAVFIPIVAVLPWLLHPSPQNWICWKESQVNSVARRAWIDQAAWFFEAYYHQGEGIIAPFGDVTGVFCRARIPISETLHEGNIGWLPTISRPDLEHGELWAVAQKGDRLSRALARYPRVYVPIKQIRVKGAPTLIIYRRSDNP